MASSPDSYDGKDSKKRGTKKRKKKGGIEPQRPVSAYALFFRDTQAAIKAENASATFGEISKIVASMWDSLSEEDKQVYKQKTENAKREYLKHLAAYRANMISKGNSIDADEEDMQPLSVLREKMVEQQIGSTSPMRTNPSLPIIDLTGQDLSLPPPPKLHPAPSASGLSTMPEAQVKLQQLPAMGSSVQLATPHQSQRPISPGATLTKIIVPGQNGATIHVINKASTADVSSNLSTLPAISSISKPIVVRTVQSNVTAGITQNLTQLTSSPIQLRNVLNNSQSPITILPSKPGQIIKLFPSESGGVRFASVNAENVRGRILKLNNLVQTTASVAPPLQAPAPTQVTASQQQQLQQTPILQLLADESTPKLREQPPLVDLVHQNQHEKIVDENTLMQIPQQNLLPAEEFDTVMEEFAPDPNANQVVSMLPRRCVRDGCTNQAVSCPYWDNEYCSNECVYSHCRDVFEAWVSTRQVTSSAV